MKKFTIRSTTTRFFFKVVVYDNTRQLIKAAQRHARTTGEETNYVGSAGVCHTYRRERHTEGTHEFELLDEIGTIRLAKTCLSTLVVSHEIVHAAMHLYRVHYGEEGNANFGEGCSPDEEDLAYLYGDLFRDVTKKLYRFGLWK